MTQPEIGGTGKGRAVQIFGSDGAKWIAALIDALGHLQIDVVASGLPGGAAEEATLAAILARLDVDLSTRAKESGGNLAAAATALQIIDGFADARNIIFAYRDTYQEHLDTSTTPNTDMRWLGTVVPSGEVDVITTLQGYNATKAAGIMHCGKWDGSQEYVIKDTRFYTPTRIIEWQGTLVLKPGDYPYIMFGSCDVGDRRIGFMTGYRMKTGIV